MSRIRVSNECYRSRLSESQRQLDSLLLRQKKLQQDFTESTLNMSKKEMDNAKLIIPDGLTTEIHRVRKRINNIKLKLKKRGVLI